MGKKDNHVKKKDKLSKNEIQIGLSVILLSLAGCNSKTTENIHLQDNIEEYSESSIIIENKKQMNDGIHLSNDAKSYGALEKEIDLLMEDLPDNQ